jgi:hypothetical protein
MTSEQEIASATSWIIYLLELGHFLYGSAVCIANLDEDLDPGVIIEIMFAKMMGKPVIGYRTEMSTPKGKQTECHSGMHFFLHSHDKIINFPNDYIGSNQDG